MKVVVTEAAVADLVRIGRAIALDNPVRAETFVAELHDRCLRLAVMPRAFPLLPRWEDRGIRRRPFGDYLIFYRLSGDTVEILHVLHGARDYEPILFPDN
ncbi:MAG: type II toxin-antitoxin system RelE/ParE family toxin [Rhodoblastus sp.]|nr:type II toxin-antitoxin system RelE/ParE family toxin [Rhodoblastus sp.]